MTQSVEPGLWARVIAPDEPILWQGRPDTKWVPSFWMIAGLIFLGLMAGQPIRNDFISNVTLYNAILAVFAFVLTFRDMWGRSRLRYAITPKRVLLAFVRGGKIGHLMTMLIAKMPVLESDMKTPASITVGWYRAVGVDSMDTRKRIVLRRIPDGPQVFDLLTSLQTKPIENPTPEGDTP